MDFKVSTSFSRKTQLHENINWNKTVNACANPKIRHTQTLKFLTICHLADRHRTYEGEQVPKGSSEVPFVGCRRVDVELESDGQAEDDEHLDEVVPRGKGFRSW